MPPPNQKKVLLCIDDDPDDFLLLREAVKHCYPECECVYAQDGIKALDLLQSLTPDLIFVDNNMPRMSGKETLQSILQNTLLQTVPVYMLSTHISPIEFKEFLRTGAAGCLVKPHSFHDLCATVQQVLDKHVSL